MNVEADFLHAGNYENLLQIDSMILMDMVKHFQSSQNSKFTVSIEYLKKEVRDEVDFLHADAKNKHQLLKIDMIVFDGNSKLGGL